LSVSDRNGHDGISFLAGLFAGVVFGTTAALLLAPRSGRETRSSMAKEARRWAVRVSGLHPQEWSDIEEEEASQNLLESFEQIRAAGL
jgi:gas vesicle protein